MKKLVSLLLVLALMLTCASVYAETETCVCGGEHHTMDVNGVTLL